jgi:hypothetical protein
MTDPTDLDELASAYLDDEATAEERARVEADPDLLARVERMREVAAAVRGGIEPQAGTTAAMQRRRALEADAGADAPEAAGPVRPPVPIGRRSTWLPSPALAAAVIVVLALAGLALLAAGGGGSDDSADGGATSREAADEAAGGDASQSTTAPQGEGGGGTESASTADRETVPDLGSFATEDDLEAALEQVSVTDLSPAGGGAAEATVDVREIVRCETSVAGQGDLGEPLAVARATLDDVPLLVFSNPVQASQGQTTTAPETQLTVVDATDCRVLFGILRR